jgi:hypothetical protein
MNRVLALASAVTLGIAAPATGAVQVVNGGGQLTGATGVVVNGVTYDVEFVDGTCSALFNSCDAVSDFTFQNSTDAAAAANALFAQVTTGTFDTDPTLTFGCGATTCFMVIPYGLNGTVQGNFDAILAGNGAASNATSSMSNSPTTFDTATNRSFVWARFAAATGVPEPSTWAMMLLGFLGIGLVVRRRIPAAA